MTLARSLVRRVRTRRRDTAIRAESPAVTSTLITDMVLRADNRTDSSRVGSEYIHVTSLLDFCARRNLLVARDAVSLQRSFTSSDRLVHAIGREVERYVRRSFIESVGYHGVFGTWRCLCGEQTYTGLYVDRAGCNRCKFPVNVYEEFTVFDHELKVSGSPDLLYVSEGRMLVVEIKSMTKTQFNPLKAPLGDHKFQSSAYHAMLERSGFDMHPEPKVLYARKEWEFSTPYKEFDFDPAPMISIFDSSLEQVRLLRDAERADTLPDRLPICTSIESAKVKGCPVGCNCISRSV